MKHKVALLLGGAPLHGHALRMPSRGCSGPNCDTGSTAGGPAAADTTADIAADTAADGESGGLKKGQKNDHKNAHHKRAKKATQQKATQQEVTTLSAVSHGFGDEGMGTGMTALAFVAGYTALSAGTAAMRKHGEAPAPYYWATFGQWGSGDDVMNVKELPSGRFPPGMKEEMGFYKDEMNEQMGIHQIGIREEMSDDDKAETAAPSNGGMLSWLTGKRG